MKIICTKSNLVKGVSIVSKAVPSKTTMPILECILIDASTDVVKLTANDMELGIETTIDGEISERGILAINARIFSEIVRKLPDSDVVIESINDSQAIITCEKAKFNIAAQSGEDFAYLPSVEKDDFITVSEYTLKEVIRQTIFSRNICRIDCLNHFIEFLNGQRFAFWSQEYFMDTGRETDQIIIN